MKQVNDHPDFKDLSELLRHTRPMPPLPPPFQEGVWRRIEESEIPTATRVNWLEAVLSRALRPRFALAAAVVLVAAGSLAGAREGNHAAHQDAQTRYVTSVAPNSLR